jgi:nitrogen fixation NifU-like protein
MSDLGDLYQELILDHKKSPRNFGELEHEHAHHADGVNPLCGDKVRVFLVVDDGVVSDVRFTGQGCAISTASASLMTEAVKGKSVEQAHALFATFHGLVAGESVEDPAPLGKLEAFAGVREFPMRVKCATLPWHTLEAALGGDDAPVSTE